MSFPLRTSDPLDRFGILETLGLLNADADPALDRLTRIAAASVHAPIALVTFLGPDRQWIRSRVGWSVECTTLTDAFCPHAQPNLGLLEVPDATLDERFCASVLVTGPEAIRFYAGHPIVYQDQMLGTVCVLDREPRTLTPAGREVLADLAGMVVDLLRLRHKQRLLRQQERHASELALALGGSQAQLARAQRVARMGSWELDVLTGVAEASEELFRLLGCDPSGPPLTFAQVAGMVHPLDQPHFQATYKQPAQPGTANQQELRVVRADGSVVWLHWVSEPVFDEAGRLIRLVGTAQDIAERKQAELELQESQERYRLLWQTTTDLVLMLDESNRIQFANPALLDLFGHEPAAAIGQDLAFLQPERLREGHRRGFARYLASGVRRCDWRCVEAIGLHRSGHEFPLEISFSDMVVGGRRMFAACVRDVSVRKRAEQALRESEARFRALTALSSDWYWELDADLRITQLSGSFGAVIHVDVSDRIGQLPWEMPGSAVDPEEQRLHRERLLRREPFRDFEVRRQNIDGAWMVLSLSAEPMFDAAGAFTGYRGVGRNVSEHKREQAAKRELAAQLRESQKMEAIGVLAGGIAHDFNNVLAAILGNAALAMQDLDAADPAQQSLQQIKKSSLRGRELVKQILTFARRQPHELSDWPLRPLVEDVIGMLRATLPAGVALAVDLTDEPLYVLADSAQIGQVLMNLCTNAWHALDGQGGHIDIGLNAVELTASNIPGRSQLPPGRYAHLWVRDDGRGMDAALQSRIYEPFFTTKPVGEGTGLGLSVVHGIVSGHAGAISVDSTPGAGSTFHVHLPLYEAPPRAAPRDALAAEPPAGRGERVMYVDDDEVMVLVVERLLQRLGYEVKTFQDGQAALDTLRADPQAFDVVVTDFNMPGLSGLDVARHLAELRPTLAVIISSGNIPEHLRAEARKTGVRAVMPKENTLEELPDVLHLVLEGGVRI